MGLKRLLGLVRYESLSQAVRAGDLGAVRKMLRAGTDPNAIPANDDTVPIFYALHQGPPMVRLLIEHGAKVNVSGRGGASPLAKAEARGQRDVAAVLRAAGARLRTADDEYEMEPRFRLQLQQRIPMLVFRAQIEFPYEAPEAVADRVQPLLNYQFPAAMPIDLQRRVVAEIRKLIINECRKTK